MADEVKAVPVLTGPTASGKTGILLGLRERHDFEIISADSRQVYRGMDIGTAKPTAEQISVLVHHLIDCIGPGEEFSAGAFAEMAEELIASVRDRGSIPVVSGGTALYIMALTGSLDPMPGRCQGIREGLRMLEEEEPGILHRMLQSIDPVSAGSIGRNDLARLVRAMELFVITSSPPSSLRKGGDPEKRKHYRVVGISVPREEHRRRIGERTRSMLEEGLVQEVSGLVGKGWGRESALGRTIGYTEVLDYLDGAIGSMDELTDAIETNTWQLARRQMNMMKRIDGIIWVEDDPGVIEEHLFGRGES